MSLKSNTWCESPWCHVLVSKRPTVLRPLVSKLLAQNSKELGVGMALSILLGRKFRRNSHDSIIYMPSNILCPLLCTFHRLEQRHCCAIKVGEKCSLSGRAWPYFTKQTQLLLHFRSQEFDASIGKGMLLQLLSLLPSLSQKTRIPEKIHGTKFCPSC